MQDEENFAVFNNYDSYGLELNGKIDGSIIKGHSINSNIGYSDLHLSAEYTGKINIADGAHSAEVSADDLRTIFCGTDITPEEIIGMLKEKYPEKFI